MVAWLVVPTSLGIAAKFALVLAGSLLLAFAVYAGVRRLAPLRFLFGMRPQVRRLVQADEAALSRAGR